MVLKQSGWRWCSSCEGLFFSENGTRGRCVADSHGHDATGSANYLVALERSDRLEQEGWRWCRKCQGLFFGGHDTEGVCPADRGQHDASASGSYVLAGEAMEDSEQNGWRWCSRCESLFFAGSSCLLYTSDAADERSSVDLG